MSNGKSPSFYDSNKVGTLFQPRMDMAIKEGLKAGVTPSANTGTKVKILLIDPQIDFIHKDGTLCVPGAIEDTRRTIEFIYRNTEEITSIAVSMDSHIPFQIFYPTWWSNEKGEHPAPYTVISQKDVKDGIWRPLVDPVNSLKYIETLEQQAKKVLMIWPFHTMIGSIGQAVEPSLMEAVAYHSAAKHSQPNFLSKGTIPQTEHYSILEPEVKVPSNPMGGLNTVFLDDMAKNDLIYIAGQAKSHCVLETMHSITRYFASSPDVLNKIRFLIDCTSPVQHPDIDFDAMTNAELKKMEALGVKLVLSTDKIG